MGTSDNREIGSPGLCEQDRSQQNDEHELHVAEYAICDVEDGGWLDGERFQRSAAGEKNAMYRHKKASNIAQEQ